MEYYNDDLKEVGHIDDNEVKELFKEMRELKTKYDALSKEELVAKIVYDEMVDFYEENEITLWCYVSDATGAKYLSNEKPVKHKFEGDSEFFLLSDGSINMRVPNEMLDMVPNLKYGDSPVAVKLSVSF